MSKIVLYDLVPDVRSGQGPSFSPFCMRARLALLHKQVDFETRPITYHELRFGEWKDKLQVDHATAPIIKRPDGTYLMDSTQIALWLDEAFPSQPNLFFPDVQTVHLDSVEYRAAVEKFESNLKDLVNPNRQQQTGLRRRGEFWYALFSLYARRIVNLFNDETKEYWTADERLGQGVWKSIISSDPEPLIGTIQNGCRTLSRHLGESQFFSSPRQPGIKDFTLMGDVQLIRSVSPELYETCFRQPQGQQGFVDWLDRMDRLYPMRDVRERDSKHEIQVCH
ncbi:uncharacterized protein JCM15063_002276 [Sporobolomyces koalae]|uniref:uncharacterized protein n=1 Tax=Sporobolomyces koalae TaxID=500713 RepID=UPI003171F267